MKKITYVLLAFAIALPLVGCGQQKKKAPVKVTQSQKAQAAANNISFTANAEIENIQRRLRLTSNPGQIGFIILLNDAGQPIYYGSVKGKVTSGGKRLTPKQRLIRCDRGQYSGQCITDAPSDEGTHGSSNPYVFFWTTDSQYMQWSGQYLYSDKPFRLNVKPLAVSIKR